MAAERCVLCGAPVSAGSQMCRACMNKHSPAEVLEAEQELRDIAQVYGGNRGGEEGMIRREYPDIEFVETDTETIENSMIALFELMYKEMTGKTKKVYPASPERLFIAWAASIVIVLLWITAASSRTLRG